MDNGNRGVVLEYEEDEKDVGVLVYKSLNPALQCKGFREGIKKMVESSCFVII